MSTLKPTPEQLEAGDFLIRPRDIEQGVDEQGRFWMRGYHWIRPLDDGTGDWATRVRYTITRLEEEPHPFTDPAFVGVADDYSSALNFIITGKVK